MNQESMNEFDVQAQKFIDATNTVMTIKFLKFAKHFINDKDYRDIYEVTLTCGDRNYTFNFGQSLNDSGFKLRYKSGTAKGQEVKYNWENQAIINMLFKESLWTPANQNWLIKDTLILLVQ